MKKILFIAMLLFSNYLNAATITWGPSTNTVTNGDIFTMDIIGTGFATNVDGGGVNIAFDSTVLSVLSVTIDEVVWDLGVGIDTGTIDNGAGTLSGLMVNAWSDVTGGFTVATVEFQAMANGSSALSLTEYALNPWAGDAVLLNPSFVAGSVSVVPLPAGVWLFGSGLIALTSLARRKHKA